MTNTSFTEFKPAASLRPYVQSYWVGEFNRQADQHFSQTVLPNGCIELIIHTTADHCKLAGRGNDWIRTPEFILVGLFDKPYEVRFSRKVDVFGIRFYPDGIRNIFGISPSEFFATYEDGVDVLGQRLREFCSRLREVPGSTEQVLLADRFIQDQLSRHVKTYDYTHIAMRRIRQVQGIHDYAALMREIPISPRQLQREFKNQYGITVRDYMRLLRLNAIQQYMHSASISLSQLPYELNFTDQSHLIREFKGFVGVAPKKFLQHRDRFIVNPIISKGIGR